MLSVIIPTLNQAKILPDTLRHAKSALESGDEIIVVDSGSYDGTGDVAARMGAKVIRSGRGRGKQINAGAMAAQGDLLLFLMPETWLPPQTSLALHRAVFNPDVLGGNFLVNFDAQGVLAHIYAAVYNTRSRRHRLFDAASAIWVRQSAFNALAGYREGVDQDDVLFCLSLRAEAQHVHPDLPLSKVLPLIPLSVTPSAKQISLVRGLLLRRILQWSITNILYTVGVPAESIERKR